ncbi:MAG: family 1 glycosylhydrolase, partial [Candidatus Gribaldobacteria bacterium]|nr:family 1 glycosylhydrolase [Candidatus Gribaldobacteria bacterium]
PPFKKNLNQEVSDMGWEIYPAGIEQVLKNYAKFKKPLFIMENGLADQSDLKRAKFITDHLKYVHQAIGQGVDVRGYFYWSLMDNFEWAEGFGPKFGLYSVDRKTLVRAPRLSAKA